MIVAVLIASFVAVSADYPPGISLAYLYFYWKRKMIKIMDRSLWYYIKRPSFAVSLFYTSPSCRTYSLFVMDLIEADMIEYDPVNKNHWKFKGTGSYINRALTNSHIDSILSQKFRKMDIEKQKRKVEEEISKHLTALKGENTQNG